MPPRSSPARHGLAPSSTWVAASTVYLDAEELRGPETKIGTLSRTRSGKRQAYVGVTGGIRGDAFPRSRDGRLLLAIHPLAPSEYGSVAKSAGAYPRFSALRPRPALSQVSGLNRHRYPPPPHVARCSSTAAFSPTARILSPADYLFTGCDGIRDVRGPRRWSAGRGRTGGRAVGASSSRNASRPGPWLITIIG